MISENMNQLGGGGGSFEHLYCKNAQDKTKMI